LLRSLVPAGFMLGPVEGRIAFVLCDGKMSVGGHQHYHYPHRDDAADHDGVHGDPTCPYAQSSGPAPLPTLPMLVGGIPASQSVTASGVAQTLLRFGPARQQTPRGPPSLA